MTRKVANVAVHANAVEQAWRIFDTAMRLLGGCQTFGSLHCAVTIYDSTVPWCDHCQATKHLWERYRGLKDLRDFR